MINKNYENLKNNYLFSTVAEKVRNYSEANPDADIIKLGIGDVTKPLAKTVIAALHKAVDENAVSESFMGYGPEQGYAFLREAIANYYGKLHAEIDASEVFVSDGAKSDIANILDIFDKNCHVVIPDPVYPVYLDTNIMDGREVSFLNANQGNNFLPMPEDLKPTRILILFIFALLTILPVPATIKSNLKYGLTMQMNTVLSFCLTVLTKYSCV